MEKGKFQFTANQHALLFAWIAKAAIDRFGKEGKSAIGEGVIKYGKQRGKRMALRVKQDGAELNVPYYMAYGEWQAKPGDMDLKFFIKGDDLNMQAHKCPWYDEWREKDLLEYGRIYCKYVDEAIVEGYNPRLKLDVTKNRSEGAAFCDFWFRRASMTKEDFEKIKQRKEELGDKAIMPWDYHIGHLYKTMSDVIVGKFGEEGETVMEEALKVFEKYYGSVATEVIKGFSDTNFDEILHYEGIKS